MSIICVYKPLCWTPLEAILAYKKSDREHSADKIAYAGRLDPMAEGLLLLLTGSDLANRDELQLLPKTYVVDMVLGIATDTYDIMGMPIVLPAPEAIMPNEEAVRKAATSFMGVRMQPYPPYSSARVEGKPLFHWARKGELERISIPQKQITVRDIVMTDHRIITVEELLAIQIQRLQKVTGMFRQQEIMKAWNKRLEGMHDKVLPVYSLRIDCSGGTYMRSLVDDIGKQLGTGAFCLRIVRAAIGPYSADTALKLE